MNTIQTLDIKNLKLVDSDCTKSSRFSDLLIENKGSFSTEDEYLVFDMNGVELAIFYNLEVSGKVDVDFGDFYSPSSMDLDITNQDVDVIKATIDDVDIDLSEDVKSLLSEVVKNYL